MQKRLVSFSGGNGSFLALKRTIDRHGLDAVTAVFCDTKAEDEDLHRFNADVEKLLGIKLVVLCDGRTPWDVVFDKKFLSGQRADCSRQLKGLLLDRYAESNAYHERVVGIGWTEKHRLDDLRKLKPQFNWEAPMCEPPYLTDAGMIHEIERLGLRPARMYGEGYPHNNCGGSCLKAGIAHWVHHLKTRPDAFAASEAKENEFRALHGDHSILKDRRGCDSQPLPLTKLREMIEAGTAPARWTQEEEWGGCGCSLEFLSFN